MGDAAVEPVASTERVSSVDTLRGFALLGILPMNIVSFALPLAAYLTPVNDAVNAYRGPFAGVGAAAWLVALFVCELKMMTIFSMLFGAGLVLMGERAAKRREGAGEAGFAAFYYRRLGVLALFGLAHGLLLWYGDILLYYALSGVLLYPLRHRRPRALLGAAAVLFVAQIGLNHWEGLEVRRTHALAEQADRADARGEELTDEEEEAQDDWSGITEDHDPSPEEVADEVRTARDASGAWHHNVEMAWYNWSSSELPFWCVRATTAMLVGMALMKLGVFAAKRSPAFYWRLVAAGYGLGLPIIAAGFGQLYRHHFDPVFLELVGRQYNFVGSYLVALGHVGVVMLACRARWARRLAAVGQMALTNYLLQSLICTLLFSGVGLGLFARFTQAGLWLFIAGIWTLELSWSAWWLARFRYGPAEWLWRSGTYGRWQPLKVQPAPG